MKQFFNRLLSIETYCNVLYTFNNRKGLCKLEQAKSKRRFAKVCLLERDAYWKAERHYSNINILDLPKLIKAEIANISPFPGHVFWQITKLKTNSASLIYIVVPENTINKIIGKCQFVYPIGLIENGQPDNEGPDMALSSRHNSISELTSLNDNCLTKFNQVSVHNLAGYYLSNKSSKVEVKQRLSFKQLLLLSFSSILIFALISTVYLSLSLSYVEDKTLNNKESVEKALVIQRELKAKFESKKDFDKFFFENKNVLAIFSDISFTNEKYRIDRVHLHPKGFKITGVSETSATNLLTILSNHPNIKEAKFSRAVAKNSAGEDIFVIEVVFI